MKISQAFPSKWLKSENLDGPTLVTITHFEMTKLQFEEIEEVKPAIFFQETDQGLVLNRTNANLIADILKSDDTQDWLGKQIGLRVEKVQFKGKMVPSIRVFDPTPPKAFGKPAEAQGDNVPDNWGPNGQPVEDTIPDPGLPLSLKKKSKAQAEMI